MAIEERTNEELVEILQSMDSAECDMFVENMTAVLESDFARGVVSECEMCGHAVHARFVSDAQQSVIRNFISDILNLGGL